VRPITLKLQFRRVSYDVALSTPTTNREAVVRSPHKTASSQFGTTALYNAPRGFCDLYFNQRATEVHITEVAMAECLVIGVIALCFVVGAMLGRSDLPLR